MARQRLDLQELEQNSLYLNRPLTCRPSLKVSKCKTKENIESKKITVVVDCKEVQRLSESLKPVSVSRNRDSNFNVTCLFNMDSFRRTWKKRWIIVKAAEPVFKEELLVSSELSISKNRLHVTIFSDSIETLINNVEANLEMLQTYVEPQHSNWPTPPVSVNLYYKHSSVSIPKDYICGQELLLNKGQVTYLIGKNGTRIEMIRQVSRATIKVLPIGKKLTAKESNHPNIVIQSISITGDWYQIALAFAHIEANLQLYKLEHKN
ncbi:RNA-binding motif protein required for MRE2-dependent mRNA splicing [Zygosaccharomyces mellis]|uniref:RNA-binding motif protein required for MRE2-dependent mRNA splicing n=1 Tax=Zygosaccharomyces mellis TaxID=42258 RepID=A0A4C2E743_9SACH|nr:RNA-binding motif protein required for MRE2-dependent mRNA splicing [Zygosaccharomyces mellis]